MFYFGESGSKPGVFEMSHFLDSFIREGVAIPLLSVDLHYLRSYPTLAQI